MVNIFMDDGTSTYEFNDDETDKRKHGDGYNPKETRGKLIKLKPERAEQIKAEFDCVVVHEFGDEYHLSEEERIAKNKFYEAFKVFSKCKHKYRKLDEFVSAMREALKCLDFVADNNGIYPPDKFKKLFFQNKIFINGLSFPQFKGRERKTISWDYLTEFILSDTPAKEIYSDRDENIYSSDELTDLETVLFDEGELDNILKEDTPEDEIRKEMYFDVDTQEQTGDIAVFLNPKKSRKLIKAQPELLNEIKEIKRDKHRSDKMEMARYVYDLTSEDIESIAEYDQRHGYISISDMPEFHGDMSKDSDYNRYLLELEDWENSQIKEDYHGKLKTKEQIQEIELKQVLEANNWNIRNLYENKEKEEKLKRIRKKEKKREKDLRRKLVEMERRHKRRMGDDFESSEPKGKKKKKKKNKKDSDDIHKEKKHIKQYNNEVSETIDDLLLGTVNNMGDWDDYKSETTDWNWDSITGGNNG